MYSEKMNVKDFGPFTFPTAYDRDRAKFFFDEGSNFLFALSVDFPGLKKIPMEYLERAKAELKALDFKVFNSGRNYRRPGCYPRTYRIFYQGPRRVTGWYRACSTRRSDATGFKIYFYSVR